VFPFAQIAKEKLHNRVSIFKKEKREREIDKAVRREKERKGLYVPFEILF